MEQTIIKGFYWKRERARTGLTELLSGGGTNFWADKLYNKHEDLLKHNTVAQTLRIYLDVYMIIRNIETLNKVYL